MRLKHLVNLLLPTLLLLAVVALAGTAFSAADLLVDERDFKDPDEGAWDFIPDYTGMAEGDNINWVWTKPGVNLSQYKTVSVTHFENRSNETDVSAQNLLDQNMKDGLERRLGLKITDKNPDITVKGAMVDYSSGNAGRYVWGYGAGQPLVEVEVYVVDNKTKEIISKVRHQAMDYSVDSVIAETINDVINYWGRR